MLRSRPDPQGSCAAPGGRVNWRAWLPKALLVGAVAWVASRLPEQALRRGFAAMVLLLAVFVAVQVVIDRGGAGPA